MGQTCEENAVELPEWHRACRAAYAMGFLFKVKVDGWKLFCERLTFWTPGPLRRSHIPALMAACDPLSSMTNWTNLIIRPIQRFCNPGRATGLPEKPPFGLSMCR